MVVKKLIEGRRTAVEVRMTCRKMDEDEARRDFAIRCAVAIETVASREAEWSNGGTSVRLY